MRRSTARQRLLIAETAAAIMAEEGCDSFHAAKQKAAARLGISDRRHLPANREIEAAWLARQQLFGSEALDTTIDELRRKAVDVMQILARFDPHLVGGLLKGTVSAFSVIQLHVFADDLKQVAVFLVNRGIVYRSMERRFRLRQPMTFSGFEFQWQGVPVEMLVFGPDDRVAPPSPVDGRPMARASIARVREMLAG